MLSHSVRRLS